MTALKTKVNITSPGIPRDKLNLVLSKLEEQFKDPFKHRSGAFSKAEVFNYDDEYIDVQMRTGIKSDCSDIVYEDQLKIPMKDFMQRSVDDIVASAY